MKKVSIQIDGRIDIEISTIEHLIIIKGYADECIMTINYPENWLISRAIQHAMSIANVAVTSNQIV